MFEPNLIKPPKILEDILSQDSENYTNNSQHKTARPKLSSKESTIRLNAHAAPQMPLPRDHDNQSVHSNASGRSKGKKTKQSTLARPKIMSNFNDGKEEDNLSVHSNASKNSHKNNKKENTIMAKPKIEGLAKQKHHEPSADQEEEKFTSFKSAWKDEDESVINPYFVQKKAVKHLQDLNALKQVQKKTSKAKFSPFAEIEQQHSNDEEPVIQLLEPAYYTNKQVVVGAKRSQQASRGAAESRMAFDESNVIFGQSKLRETKSRRRNIFEKSSIDNTSKVSQSIAESSVLGESNRSRSKRREIFNSSREKQRKAQEESKAVIQNDSNMLTIGQAPFQSKDMSSYRKPSPKKVSAFVQLEKKVLHNENDDFGLDQSKSDLNLSASNHLGRDTYDRDSLILQLQPEKRKGVSIVGAKNYRQSKESTQNMLQLQNNNLASIAISQTKQQSKDMVKVNNNLVSKELQDVKKLLSANQEYLNNLQHVALADSYQPNDKNYNTLNKNVEEREKPWHEIVNDYERIQPLNIKKVQRNEKIVNKAHDKGRADVEKEKIAELERKRLQERQDQERRKAEQLRQQQQQKQRELQKRMQQQRRRERQQRDKEMQLERQRQQREKQEQRLKRQAELRKKRQLELQEKAKQEQQRIREQQLRAEKLRDQRLRKQRQLQRQRQLEAQEREKEIKLKKLASLPSQISREEFSQNSEHSNKSSRKQRQKKENSISRDKNHKVYIRAQSPRGEESFYQSQNEPSEQLQDKKQQTKQDKKPKLLSFEQEDFETKPKARTDINFYDNAPSQKSLKPPSSKPPLSKRTNGSGGSLSKQKRPKQKTIAITIKEQSLKPNKSSFKQKEPKKMSLMERAMMKHNEESSNGSYSQDSYRNRDDIDSEQSRNSHSSKQSRGSLKKQSTLKISKENMIHSKYANLPPRRQSSNSSSHEEEIQRIERQRMAENEGRASQQRQQLKKVESNRMKEQILNERVIVSKNCTYIDERGRLVTQDLVIKGKDVYGIPSSNKNIEQTVMQRMKRSRDERRSRSKSRDRNKLQKKKSRDSCQNEYNQNSSYSSSSFYANSSRASLQRNESASLYSNYGNYEETNTLKQFIKPVQQVPNMYDQRSRRAVIKEEKEDGPRTLNDMFARKNGTTATNSFNNNSSAMQNSRSRKSLGRTEKSFYKK